MLEHTRVFTLVDAPRESVEERSDALADALMELEEGHPELLDSAVFTDLGQGTIGVTITLGHESEYVDAVKDADALLKEAIGMIGDHLRGSDDMPPAHGVLIKPVDGAKSLTVA
ncbi:hypothetical protein SD455_12610 [Nesterenkonia sp. K-15-9-6]